MDYKTLYDDTDRLIMKTAEDSLNPKEDRVSEIIAFAKEAGITKIGIANCISFEKEAAQLEEELKHQGFNVFRYNCKLGRLPAEDILPGYKGVSCNPAGQAHMLEEADTGLNIVMGLCLGHDMVFTRKSKALVTSLVVKDRKLNHHTLSKFSKEIND